MAVMKQRTDYNTNGCSMKNNMDSENHPFYIISMYDIDRNCHLLPKWIISTKNPIENRAMI